MQQQLGCVVAFYRRFRSWMSSCRGRPPSIPSLLLSYYFSFQRPIFSCPCQSALICSNKTYHNVLLGTTVAVVLSTNYFMFGGEVYARHQKVPSLKKKISNKTTTTHTNTQQSISTTVINNNERRQGTRMKCATVCLVHYVLDRVPSKLTEIIK